MILFLSLFTMGIVTHRVVLAQNMTSSTTTCSEDMDTFCATEGNRYCYLSSGDNGNATCGNCLPGYVEWRSRCIGEDRVDIALFLDEYQPLYLTTLSDTERASLLLSTIRFIAEYQNQNPPLTFQLGLNKFSADDEQDQKALLGFNPQLVSSSSSSNAATEPPVTFQSLAIETDRTLPTSVDWVTKGVVTSVKDQERCGCCWAISVVGAVEGAAALQNDFLQSLSFQQFISCDDRNLGCDGGSVAYAMAYPILDTDGIARDADYKFTDGKGKTTYDCNTKVSTAVAVGQASYVVDYYDDLTFDERLQRMKTALAKQPVAMVLRAGCKLFSNYNSGILTSDDGCECEEPTCADHAVLMVGYDDSSDPPYWKIKNSWGTGWGEDGYFRVAQTQKGDYGLFGVLTHGIVPDLTFNMTSGTVSDSDPLFPPEQEDEPLPWWAWLLILLTAIAVACVILSCGMRYFCPREKAPAQVVEEGPLAT